jgi:hypothetical protein
MNHELPSLQDVRSPYEVAEVTFAEPPRDSYDAAALGVECAWPAAEREVLLARS